MSDDAINPFSPEQAPGVQVVILMRIYDVLMALLQESNGELHDTLDAIHERGEIAWSLPTLNLSPPDASESESIVPPAE